MAMFKTAISLAAGASLLFAASVAMAGGVKPCPDDYKMQAANYVEARLEDPRGARVQIVSDPYRVSADIRGHDSVQGWGVDIRVKSRLPNGSYGRFVPYTVIFVDGRAVALQGDTSHFDRV